MRVQHVSPVACGSQVAHFLQSCANACFFPQPGMDTVAHEGFRRGLHQEPLEFFLLRSRGGFWQSHLTKIAYRSS